MGSGMDRNAERCIHALATATLLLLLLLLHRLAPPPPFLRRLHHPISRRESRVLHSSLVLKMFGSVRCQRQLLKQA